MKFFFLAVFISFFFVSSCSSDAEVNEGVDIIILHDNDLHFRFENWEEVQRIKEKYIRDYGEENVFLFNAGDIFHSHRRNLCVHERKIEAEKMVRKMNQAGYDAMALGNHEFDYGHPDFFPEDMPGFYEYGDVYAQALQKAEFPLLSANITVDGREFADFKPFVHFDINGTRLMLLGLTDTVFTDWSHDLIIQDPIKAAQEYAQYGKDSDIFIALSHLGARMDEDLAKYLGGNPYGLDIIVGGHSHDILQTCYNEVLISQAGTKNRYLGKIKLKMDDNSITDIKTGFIDLETGEYLNAFLSHDHDSDVRPATCNLHSEFNEYTLKKSPDGREILLAGQRQYPVAGEIQDGLLGNVERFEKRHHEIWIQGWASDKEYQPPRSLFVFKGNQLLMKTLPHEVRQDVVEHFNRQSMLFSGFSARIPAEMINNDPDELRLFALTRGGTVHEMSLPE